MSAVCRLTTFVPLFYLTVIVTFIAIYVLSVSIVIFVKIIIIMERPQNGPPLLKVYLKDG